MERTLSNIGSLLRLYRTVHNLGVRDFAPMLGISIATLSRIERGHAMDADTFVKVINWLVKR